MDGGGMDSMLRRSTRDSYSEPDDQRRFRMLFFLGRAKDRSPAAGALSHVAGILLAYLKRFGAELMEATPLFWTRGGGPVSSKANQGNGAATRRRARISEPRPIYQSSLNQDSPPCARLALARAEKATADMRRSGAVKGDADGATVAD